MVVVVPTAQGAKQRPTICQLTAGPVNQVGLILMAAIKPWFVHLFSSPIFLHLFKKDHKNIYLAVEEGIKLAFAAFFGQLPYRQNRAETWKY